MNRSELKKLIINSTNADNNSAGVPVMLEKEGVSYNFSENFADRVLDKVFATRLMTKQLEFAKYMNFAFYRVALTGVAAIIILLISMFINEGSLSFNSFLGLSDSYDESIVSLLTGN